MNAVGCMDNGDCARGEWCRPTQDGGNACARYQLVGEQCGGFVPPAQENRCLPGLTCSDFGEGIADAPGRCRQPCANQDECGADEYCSDDNVCRNHGLCWTDNDCNINANAYPRPRCVGSGVCSRNFGGVEQGMCMWICDDRVPPDDDKTLGVSSLLPVCT